MTSVERNMFTFYLKKIVSEYRRPLKEPKFQPSTDIIFEKVPIKYEQLESYLLMKKKTKAYNILKSIYDDVSILCEGANSKFVWESTLYVLKLFHDKDRPLLEHNRELERLFGIVDFATTEKFFKAVKEFKNNFEDDPLYLRLGLGGDYEEPEKYYEQKTLPSLYISEKESNAKIHSESEIKQYEKQLIRRLKKLELEQKQKINNSKKVQDNAEIDIKGDTKKWILDLIKKYGNPNLDKHADRFIDILRSNRDDNEIQEELVSFIGFENITLAEFLLKNRYKVKNAAKTGSENVKLENKPALGPQVIVQSKQEKSLAKKLMKLQKKQSTSLNATLARETNDYEQVKQEYLNAKKAPLLRKSAQSSSQNLPNVYDAQNASRFAQVVIDILES